jgi:hypothetical protein
MQVYVVVLADLVLTLECNNFVITLLILWSYQSLE